MRTHRATFGVPMDSCCPSAYGRSVSISRWAYPPTDCCGSNTHQEARLGVAKQETDEPSDEAANLIRNWIGPFLDYVG